MVILNLFKENIFYYFLIKKGIL